KEDYRMYDAKLMSEVITQEISFIYKHWISSEVAVFTLLVDHNLAHIPNAEELFATLRDLQLRTTYEYVGYASANLAYRASCVNRLSIPQFHLPPITSELTSADEEAGSRIDIEALRENIKKILIEFTTQSEIITYRKVSTLIENLAPTDNLAKDGSFISVRDFIKEMYRRSEQNNFWLLARFCFAKLDYSHLELSDSITILAARNLSVIVGNNNFTELVIDQSFANARFF